MIDISLSAIRKKLIGQNLTYEESFSIMNDVGHDKLSPVQTTFFVASNYSAGISDEEIYFLTKAMAESGQKLKFEGIVADKHSIGGLGGTRTSLILVPIIAASGIKIPKLSSRAITSPAGTADAMEVLAPVTFTADEIQKIVETAGGCIAWGGSTNIAPADDKIIQIEKELQFESFDQIIISIMAKKIACGANHIIIELPFGQNMKLKNLEQAKNLKNKFETLSQRLEIKIIVSLIQSEEPAGRGIGASLSARDALRILQQKNTRCSDLEKRSLGIAGQLLELCQKAKTGEGENLARQILVSGQAWKKMAEIISAQGGKAQDSEEIILDNNELSLKSLRSGKVAAINNKALNKLSLFLGSSIDKKAGLYLQKKIGDKVEKEEEVILMYARSAAQLQIAKQYFPLETLYSINKD